MRGGLGDVEFMAWVQLMVYSEPSYFFSGSPPRPICLPVQRVCLSIKGLDPHLLTPSQDPGPSNCGPSP